MTIPDSKSSIVQMKEKIVFSDHDGLLTDSQKEMSEYSQIVVEYNAITLGLTSSLSENLLFLAKARILEDPGNYGWKWGKDQLIVAAATSDHYLFNQAATEVMLNDLSSIDLDLKKKIEDIGGSEKYLIDMFGSCAPRLGVFYRPEARDFLTELSKMDSPWAIVTNSDATKVSKKLSTLNLGFEPKVVGGAKKFEVNREWQGLLPTGPYKGFPGYPERGIELQRQTFYNVLEKEAGEKLKDLIFVEDVAEFVSWIDFLSENNSEWSNAKTALIFTPMTPKWERNRYSEDSKNRFGSESLMEILNWISKQ